MLGSSPEIVIVGFTGCLGSGLVGAADILALSLRMLPKKGGAPAFGVTTASFDGLPVTDGAGRRLAVDKRFDAIASCAAIIVPGYVCDGDDVLPATSEIGAASAWMRQQHSRGAIVSGACNGVFLLGEAGLLDGRHCTTTWWRHDALKTRFPRADAAWGAALIDDRHVVTAGGPLSWIDLSLYVIRALCGPEAAKTAADFTVVDTVPSSQSIYIPPGHLAASNPFLLEAERIVRQSGEEPMTAHALARALGTSARTLHRRLKLASGEAPKTFIDRVRFETARMLLETTANSVKQLAAKSGYSDETSFRRAFHRYAGMTPVAYRNWSRARRA